MSPEQWDEMQDVNVKSIFHTTQAVLPQMIARKSGKIVNISSVTFHLGTGKMAHYVASKGAVIGLTRALSRDFGEHNIYVNCVTPGAIRTESESILYPPKTSGIFWLISPLRGVSSRSISRAPASF